MASVKPDIRSLEATEWRKLYNTKAWNRARLAQFSRQPLCEPCQRLDRTRAATVVNHKIPHKGDRALFFDPDNHESSCKPCHDGPTQSAERCGYSKETGADGWPVDPNHPANGGQPQSPRGNNATHPYWLKASRIPLTIVCGPPGSGKSTYVQEHAGPTDLIICIDTIAARLYPALADTPGGKIKLDKRQVVEVLRQRNEMLGDIMRRKHSHRWPRAWLIVSEPTRDKRQWWAETMQPEKIIVMATPAAECIRRAKSDATAGIVRTRAAVKRIESWWAEYEPRQGDTVLRDGD